MVFLEDWLQEAAKQTATEAAMDAQIFFAFLDAMIKRCLLGPLIEGCWAGRLGQRTDRKPCGKECG
jgi:hypothetical protein